MAALDLIHHRLATDVGAELIHVQEEQDEGDNDDDGDYNNGSLQILDQVQLGLPVAFVVGVSVLLGCCLDDGVQNGSRKARWGFTRSRLSGGKVIRGGVLLLQRGNRCAGLIGRRVSGGRDGRLGGTLFAIGSFSPYED